MASSLAQVWAFVQLIKDFENLVEKNGFLIKNGLDGYVQEGGVEYWRSYPRGIKLLLDYVKFKYNNPPIYITEIGIIYVYYILTRTTILPQPQRSLVRTLRCIALIDHQTITLI